MAELPDAIFHLDGAHAVPTELARGPWSPHAMHGGAPAALLARAFEGHDPGPAGFVTRMTLELLRPVPLVPLTVRIETIRPGRKVQWLQASIEADSREVVRGTALRLRADPGLGIAAPAVPSVDVPPPSAGSPVVLDPSDGSWGERSEVGFGRAFELREVAGSFMTAGPATVWFRLAVPLIAGEEPSPLQRVVATADFGNGISALFQDGRHTFINADLTVSLWRLPAGEWIGIDSVTHAAPHGVGVAESVLFDGTGRLGRALQSLLIDRT